MRSRSLDLIVRPTMYFATLAALAANTLAAPSLDSRQATQKVTVDLTKKYQTIDGFGFSGAFQRANLVVNLQEPKQSEILNLLFNTTSGAGFSIVRNGIGSSKTSQSDWMNTILPNCPSTPDGIPDYKWDGKDSGQVWLSQKAWSYGVRTFYANAWSAPGCMKTNGNDANGGQLCGVRRWEKSVKHRYSEHMKADILLPGFGNELQEWRLETSICELLGQEHTVICRVRRHHNSLRLPQRARYVDIIRFHAVQRHAGR